MSDDGSYTLPEPPTPFCLAPSLVVFGVIDYTTDEGRKLFKKSTQKLNEDLFELTPENKPLFLDKLYYRAKEVGWCS